MATEERQLAAFVYRDACRSHWRLPLAALALLTASLPASAQSGPDTMSGNKPGFTTAIVGENAAALQPIVDRIVGQAVEREAIPGLIVGVSWKGQRSYFGYSGTHGVPYRPNTIVEIGSITKVFTTALFAEAVLEGRMQRDVPIQSYMPHRKLHPCTAKITPLQLADFTSGMPTLPGNVPRQLGKRGIENYTSRDFLNWVARWRSAEGCNHPAPYRYSNASVGLLGYLVADRLGERWEELIHRRITRPLKMHDTVVRVPAEHRERVAQGHGANGQPVIHWPVFAWYAAGALRSTAADMLAFGEAALGHETINGQATPAILRKALKEAMVPIYHPEGQVFGQGMAWVENVGDADEGQRPVFLKVGGTDGFNSVIVINEGKDLAIFIAGAKPRNGAPRLGVALSRQIR